MTSSGPSSSYADEAVRRLVNPYPWRDYVRVVARNLTQRPVTRYSDLTRFVDAGFQLLVPRSAPITAMRAIAPDRGRWAACRGGS